MPPGIVLIRPWGAEQRHGASAPPAFGPASAVPSAHPAASAATGLAIKRRRRSSTPPAAPRAARAQSYVRGGVEHAHHMCLTYRTRAALPWPRPHCARCVPWRAADAAAPHGCMLLDLAFAWSVSPQSVVCPVLRGGVGWEGRRSVRDACACELEQERARTLHPIKSQGKVSGDAELSTF